jgi:hypothetical protein
VSQECLIFLCRGEEDLLQSQLQPKNSSRKITLSIFIKRKLAVQSQVFNGLVNEKHVVCKLAYFRGLGWSLEKLLDLLIWLVVTTGIHLKFLSSEESPRDRDDEFQTNALYLMTSSLSIAENLIYHHRFVFTTKEEENGDLLNTNVKKRCIWPIKEIAKNETSLIEMAFFSKKYDDALGTNFLINISPIDLSLST